MHIKGSVSTESMHDRGWLQVVNKRQSVLFLLTLININQNSINLWKDRVVKWPYGVMVSHQLDVLRVPRSILGEANLFPPRNLVFSFSFCPLLLIIARTQPHQAQPVPALTHTLGHSSFCVFRLSDVSCVCSLLFFFRFALLWFFRLSKKAKRELRFFSLFVFFRW